IIGILATIAIPRFGSTRTSAQIAVMKSDLRNLATAQEVRFTQAGSYTAELSDLSATFQPSDGVSIAITLDGTVYTATATVSGVVEQCTLTVNSTLPASPECAVPQVEQLQVEPPGE
ncbi:MAG: type IV pilin protein, partial [Gemmatimonadaceae bacterium]